MTADSLDHTLAVFEGFLRWAREPQARVHAVPSRATPSEVPLRADDLMATTREDDPLDVAVTRVAPRPTPPPTAVASSTEADRALPARSEPPQAIAPHGRAPAKVQGPGHERSIIVEEETLTDPEFERSALLGTVDLRGSARIPVEQFVHEMSVLVKYGHTVQAAEETERWIASHPDDLAAQIQLTEFQLARLDRDAAIDRFVSLVGRMIERGESVQAGDLVNRLRRDAPGDHRVGALASRMGRP